MANTDVYDVLRAQFAEYGLADLADTVIKGAVEGITPNEAYLRIRDTDAYKTRFAGNQMRKANGMRELTEAEYITRERALEDQFAAYDIPKGFYDDPADKAKAIAADLGAEELGARLDARKQIVEDGAMTGVLAYAQAQYGLSTGDLIAFFIDPDRAGNLFQRRQNGELGIVQAAKIGAAAARSGFGGLAGTEAERLANFGITQAEAEQGFSQAASLRGLEQDIEGGAVVTDADLTGAVFDQNADARKRIERVQEARKARFAGGGGYAEGKEGVTGLGSANTA